ncbi:MAG: M28 family peptidase [Thermoleophilia bacterium]|nr:M28 family peptidase [Thermoleophilia bacterium]
MLNARLYRTAWLVSAVAIIVALLTLQPPATQGLERPALPGSADARTILRATEDLRALAPVRVAGSPAAEQASADWVARQFASLPSLSGLKPRVRRQVFSARVDGELERMVNVYAVLPGTTGGLDPQGIVVMAPRDSAPGSPADTSSTALLLEAARYEATAARRHPMLFVSTSGSAVGNAGARWFLSRFSDFRISAVIVLDGVGERDGPVWVWGGARTPTQALGFASIVRETLPWSGATAAPEPSLINQLLRFAVPQTFGDQAPFVQAGIPAVTLSSRPDGPARPVAAPDAQRLQRAGNVAVTLLSLIDQNLAQPRPESGVMLSGKELKPGVLRIVLALFALPLWVVALDAFSRLRRSGVRMGPGMRAALLRSVPLVVACFALHFLSLMHLMPQPAAGVPPLPRGVGFGAGELVSVVVTLALAALAWWLSHRAMRRLGAAPASEAAAGLILLGVVSLVAWFVTPFVLVLTLPAAHAVLVATSVTRRWHAVILGLVGLLPLAALCVSVGTQLGRNPFFAAWYLIATTAGGARGTVWPVFALLLSCAILSMAILVFVRFRKGLMRREHRRRVPRPRLVAKARLPRIER